MKTTNLERLRLLLDDGSQLTLSQLQEQLAVSERQVRRLLQELRQAGITVQHEYHDGRKHFFLAEEDQRTALPNPRFSQAELKAFTLAAKASQTILAATPHAKPLRSGFDKLLEQVDPVAYVFDVEDQLQTWHFESMVPDAIALDNFRKLDQAIADRCSVRIDYTTGGSGKVNEDRRIDPYFLAKRGRSWMVIGYCHQRKALRNFALVRISQVACCDPAEENAIFTIPEDFVPEEYFRGAFGAINSDTVYDLRLLVEPNKAFAFRDRKYHTSQKIEEERQDGRLVVTLQMEGWEEIRSFVQGWGVGVTVLDPPELRKRLYQEAQELANRYQTDAS
ncbi:MAG: WYL domain-containing protein [Tunicatimonas sp.]|uniref:helix-turn-helix transcriptional regulator n=1 Tax=Tunicatimonas sp. TaxID=1940096 RepID=UPI003C7755D7